MRRTVANSIRVYCQSSTLHVNEETEIAGEDGMITTREVNVEDTTEEAVAPTAFVEALLRWAIEGTAALLMIAIDYMMIHVDHLRGMIPVLGLEIDLLAVIEVVLLL